ncbi:MAG: 50S ribosomal protein L29 [Deltaproteobacteria bacterium CG_4_10_14_3_um_filter_60_8]|nr:MAG: 50S ribosomal protein L29 [Desulfobacterales bacterium CG2_30_60_27]PIP43958.1 MAG: 50S ribosomal protein L29 [Deltaproteobacteria bacterium CG23_combo_of_CG06-09_8_20_14_all_60_8]PIY20857.1 MAG: 50S ribosomal protein L29 [Deltaproteobacteria bacterium CG_4_10_14_3_um_filter_60_8]
MKLSEIRGLDMEALVAKAKDLGEELFKLRFKHGIRPLENTATLSVVKKSIARVKTIIAEKQAAAR